MESQGHAQTNCLTLEMVSQAGGSHTVVWTLGGGRQHQRELRGWGPFPDFTRRMQQRSQTWGTDERADWPGSSQIWVNPPAKVFHSVGMPGDLCLTLPKGNFALVGGSSALPQEVQLKEEVSKGLTGLQTATGAL